MNETVTRYHPLLVALHWVLTLLIAAALYSGYFELAETANTDPGKIAALKSHMVVGMLILFLMLFRFAVRLATYKPGGGGSRNRINGITRLSHYSFYLVVVLMAGSGFAMALLAGLPDIVFAGSGEPLPSTFITYPPRGAHGIFAVILVGLIVLHLLGLCYRQVAWGDRPLRRMSFGRRRAAEPGTEED